MSKVILTKYHGPSNVRGSRVSATDGDNRVVLSWNHSLNADENHTAAAVALCDKLHWRGSLHSGTISKRGVFVAMAFVFSNSPVTKESGLFVDGKQYLGPVDPEARCKALARD